MKLMCHRWRRLMLAELDCGLTAENRSRLETHLTACADCRAQQSQLLSARRATAVLRQERAEAPVPVDLAASVMQRVRLETASERLAENETGRRRESGLSQPGSSRGWRGAAAMRTATALATLVLVFALVAVYQAAGPSLRSRQAQTVSAPSPTTTIISRQQEHELGADTSGLVTDGVKPSDQPAKPSDYQAYSASGSDGPTSKSAGPAGLDTRSSGAALPATGGTATGSTGAGSGYSGGSAGSETAIINAANDGYRLYTGNLTDLGTLVPAVPGFRLPPQLLSDAANLRILVKPADAAQPVRQVVVLAGYPADTAARYAEQYRSALPATSNRVTVETVVPDSLPRLAAIFGDTLLASLLPTAGDRQLTYIMITIGG